MRKPIYYIIAFVIICIISDAAIKNSLGKEIDNQSPYCLSFASIGANLLESRLDCWAKIKMTSTSKELDENLIHVLNHLELPVEPHKFIHQRDNETVTLQYQYVKNNESYTFWLKSNQKEADFLATIVVPGNSQKLRNYELKLQEIMDCSCYYLYSGSIGNLYNQKSQVQLLKGVIKGLDAQVIDVYQDDKVVSMTAYSRKLSPYVHPVKASQKKYNLQVAIKSNFKKQITMVYIGSPLILGEY